MNFLTTAQRLLWLRRIAYVQIAFATLLFVVAFATLLYADTRPFFAGVRETLLDGAGATVFDAAALGALSAPLLLSVVVSVSVILGLHYRSFYWGAAAYSLLVVHVVGTLGQGGIALFSLALLFLVARKDVAIELGVQK